MRHNTSGVVGAAFLQAGTVQIDTGLAVSVNQPCVAVLRFSGDEFGAAIANPKNQTLAVQMTVTRNLTGPGAVWSEGDQLSRLSFSLPGGSYGGQSVVQEYVNTPVPTSADSTWMMPGADFQAATPLLPPGWKCDFTYAPGTLRTAPETCSSRGVRWCDSPVPAIPLPEAIVSCPIPRSFPKTSSILNRARSGFWI